MTKRKTTHTRIYRNDLTAIKLKFPEVKMPDFIHMAVKTNPLMQIEASLRKKKKK